MREKLIVLLAECFDKCLKSRCMECEHFNAPPIIGNRRSCQAHLFADYLIANGVTVGKPLSQFLHPVDAYPGLKAKYLVFKGDTGEKVENCFVLRPDKDPAAVEALRAYARTTENETLAQDIYNWVGQGEPVQQWIPVTDRLPTREDATEQGAVLAWELSVKHWDIWAWDCVRDYADRFVGWMPLPEPPKGE